MARGFLFMIAAGAVSAAARADDWTGPKDVAKSAQEFAGAAQSLGKAIKDVNEDSPLVAEVRSLSDSAARLHDSVAGNARYQDAVKDFRKIESGYAHVEAALKKAHDVHHEKPVADAAKTTGAKFDQLRAHMSGRRPSEISDQSNPRPTGKDDR